LIALRKTHRSLLNTSRDSVSVQVHGSVLAVERDKLLLLFNFSPDVVAYTDERVLKKKFDSAASIWNGPGALELSLQPLSAVIYEIL
jgi:maltooligosyltrehalose trehalohydrolase